MTYFCGGQDQGLQSYAPFSNFFQIHIETVFVLNFFHSFQVTY